MTATTRTPKKSEGALITIAQLEDDPYPIYARVQQREPISRIPALGMPSARMPASSFTWRSWKHASRCSS